MKKEMNVLKARRLINSGNLVLITSAYEDKQNILTLAWITPLSHDKPLIGISAAKGHFTTELIKKSKEFIINIPTSKILDKVIYCGKNSGRNINKFNETGLNKSDPKKLRITPSISECPGIIECIVKDVIEVGDHILFVGEVVFAEVEETLFNDVWKIDKVDLIYHLGGSSFINGGEKI